MNILKFRILLVLEQLTFWGAMSLALFFENPNLEKVKNYAETFDPVLSDKQIIFLAAWFILYLVINVVSFLGLFFLKNWARYTYLGTFALSLVSPLLPYNISVSGDIEEFLSSISLYCNGAILAIIFLSPFKDEFKKVL